MARRKKISQAQARGYRRRVAELERQVRLFHLAASELEWPGKWLADCALHVGNPIGPMLEAAAKCERVVVARAVDHQKLRLWLLNRPGE